MGTFFWLTRYWRLIKNALDEIVEVESLSIGALPAKSMFKWDQNEIPLTVTDDGCLRKDQFFLQFLAFSIFIRIALIHCFLLPRAPLELSAVS